jgi:acetyl-CoA carboxylase beta subunit
VPEDDELASRDPLAYPDYRATLAKARSTTGADESVRAGSAAIGGHAVELAEFEFGFLGGSMGEVAGERLARSIERAARRSVPFVLHTATGGARMQEGMRALVQMPKVVAARIELEPAHLPFVAVLGHPTTGGVLASLCALADVTLAIEGSVIGFAGPPLVEQFTGRSLAPGSHTAGSKYTFGLVDDVVAPAEAPKRVAQVLDVLADDDPEPVPDDDVGSDDPAPLDGWAAVLAARALDRPRGPDLLAGLGDRIVWLRGDRAGTEDLALAAAVVRIFGRRALVLALDRDHAPGPGAFRKARRCVGVACRLGIPLVTLVDTRGADPSEGSEAQGVAWEIGALFEAMLSATVPVVSFVTGEGGSGGALAFATADRLIAVSDSVFSVIAPEAAATILWRDPGRAPEIADGLHLTARDLVDMGIADELMTAPLEARTLAAAIARRLDAAPSDLPAARRRRWREI